MLGRAAAAATWGEGTLALATGPETGDAPEARDSARGATRAVTSEDRAKSRPRRRDDGTDDKVAPFPRADRSNISKSIIILDNAHREDSPHADGCG